MNHAAILPIVIPFVAAIVVLAGHRLGPSFARAVFLAAGLLLIPVSAWLIDLAGGGGIAVYALGDWPAPFGIVLVLDRLSAIMVALTTAVAVPAMLYATAGTDTAGRHFHALFLLQIAGLNGAFLTGDLFNLFVFFEVLLLASYGLMVHGAGLERVRAGLAYVILNLTGSALFLVALGLIYGMLGTLNLADMAVVLPGLPDGDYAVVRTAFALLVAVFALKAALLPLSFWLPHAYAATSAAVAALFAIMTKVGIYALLRVSVIGFGSAPVTADLLQPWLLPLALATIALGTIGALAARRLAAVVANLVVVSTGTLFAAMAGGEAGADAAALYYLVHTTLVTAAFFLLADLIAAARGGQRDTLERGGPPQGAALLGFGYLILAVAASGMPPLSGFLGKIMILRAVQFHEMGAAIWIALILSGLVTMLLLARAASALFWEAAPTNEAVPTTAPGGGSHHVGSRRRAVALCLLVGGSPLLTVAAAPVSDYVRAASDQLHARQPYVAAVLGQRRDIARERRP
ncbi:MAG: monovalent cation/H+ antiporter subunit D [Reyranella sp.]|nr:monovalent cation/H+ antiporter subunit D [Reyranella sp.]